uniref:C-type lectin domain-containing protein n=1 Tax=Anopheles dirus TaxID=7168 RepID=A0A182NPC4_9DIPT
MEGSWIWLSRNVPVAIVGGYTNWASTEPNNVVTATNTENCLNIGFFGNSKWNDAACDSSFYYVCEPIHTNCPSMPMSVAPMNHALPMLPAAWIAVTTRAFSPADSMDAKWPPYSRHVCHAVK